MKLFVAEACLHVLITCICTCFLCAAVKNSKIILFCRSELRYRVSDKLGPAARKQKINTFKLLKVMHKYLSAIHAASSRERFKSSNPIDVYFSCFVCFFFCQETIYGKAVFVFLFPVSKKEGLKWNLINKVHQQRNQTLKPGETTNRLVLSFFHFEINTLSSLRHFGTLILISPEINCCFKGKAVINSFLEQFLWVICLRKFIRYQTLDLSRVGHACQPKLVCSGHMFLFTYYEFPRQPKCMRYWINHIATVKTKTVQPVPKIQPV